MVAISFIHRMHPESRIDGFTQHDGTVRFFTFVWAAILRTGATKVMDYGAGRGAFFFKNTPNSGSLLRKYLQDLRNTGARVTACDIDPVVLDHPCSDEQVHIDARQPLPFADDSFDIIVSDNTFEHVDDVGFTAAELIRVLRPGGYICARTPSKYGYVALTAAIIPNRLHTAALRYVQPRRKAEDTFPTVYRLNTPTQLRRYFAGCAVYHFYASSEPAYAFDNRFVYRAFLLLHRFLPGPLNTTLCAFIHKPPRSPA